MVQEELTGLVDHEIRVPREIGMQDNSEFSDLGSG